MSWLALVAFSVSSVAMILAWKGILTFSLKVSMKKFTRARVSASFDGLEFQLLMVCLEARRDGG